VEITQRVGLYSIGVNSFLVALKLGLAALTGSLALTADGLHSLIDIFASGAVLAGVLIAQRRSTAFPYGLYKVENVVTVTLALLIFLAGYEIVAEAIAAPAIQVANPAAGLAGVAVAMATAYAFSRYERKLGEKTGSPSILADSQHFRTDVMASGVVFVSILGSAVGVPLDRIGAIGVVGFIVYAGWELLVDGMRVLLDASLDWKTMEKVERLIAADPDVVKIKSLEGRNAGRYRFIEATIVVDVKDLESAHRVSERVETSIKRGIPRVERVLIHYEPQEKAIVRWAIPVDESKEMVSPHLGKAPFFTLIDLKKSTGEVVGRKTVVNPYLNVEKQKGILVAQFLVSEGVDGLVLRAVLEDKGPRFVLSGAGVQTLVTDIEEAEAVIEELRRRRGEAQQAQ